MNLNISYSDDNTHVENSYLVEDIGFEVGSIIRERYLRKLQITRTYESYVREWKGHNRLYKLHLFRSHTKDVDLNENNSGIEELIWKLIGR